MQLTNRAIAKKQFKHTLTVKAGGRLHPIWDKRLKKWVIKEVATRKTYLRMMNAGKLAKESR